MQIAFSRKTLLAFLGSAMAAIARRRPEDALLRAARNRDRDAFADLMAVHREPLRRFVARRVNEGDREDVLQETWLAAWESLPSFDCSGSFRTWLFSICFHKIQDHWRREHCRPPSSDIVDAEGRTAYLPREYAAVELRESMREFWESCTPEQRELLRMYYADGLTLKEISALLNRNLNTVKYQFYRVHATAAERLPEPPEIVARQVTD